MDVIHFINKISRLLTPEELKLLEFNDGEVSRSFQERMIDRFGKCRLACSFKKTDKKIRNIVKLNRCLLKDDLCCCDFLDKFRDEIFKN